jgi:hypothetical protein
VPAHSLHAPQSFVEECQVARKEISDDVIAILDNSQGQRPKAYLERIMLPALGESINIRSDLPRCRHKA